MSVSECRIGSRSLGQHPAVRNCAKPMEANLALDHVLFLTSSAPSETVPPRQVENRLQMQ
jgi:hypothetical protein